jgi:hypothetical protein
MALKRQAGYPKLTRTGEGDVLTNLVYETGGVNLAAFLAMLPAIGAVSADLATVYLSDYEIATHPDHNSWWFATLTYKSQQLYAYLVRNDGDTEYELEDGGLRNPLPLHPDYKWCWDHHAVKRKDAAAWVDPCSYDSDIVQSEDGAQKYRWIDNLSELPVEPNGERWMVVLERKKAFDEYIAAAPIVAMKKYYKTKATAIAACTAQAVGKLQVPGERFGIGGAAPGDAKEWLIISKGLLFDGKYWIMTVRYQWANPWDTEVYSVA